MKQEGSKLTMSVSEARVLIDVAHPDHGVPYSGICIEDGHVVATDGYRAVVHRVAGDHAIGRIALRGSVLERAVHCASVDEVAVGKIVIDTQDLSVRVEGECIVDVGATKSDFLHGNSDVYPPWKSWAIPGKITEGLPPMDLHAPLLGCLPLITEAGGGAMRACHGDLDGVNAACFRFGESRRGGHWLVVVMPLDGVVPSPRSGPWDNSDGE